MISVSRPPLDVSLSAAGVFQCYDVDGDGYISGTDLFHVLKMMVGSCQSCCMSSTFSSPCFEYQCSCLLPHLLWVAYLQPTSNGYPKSRSCRPALIPVRGCCKVLKGRRGNIELEWLPVACVHVHQMKHSAADIVAVHSKLLSELRPICHLWAELKTRLFGVCRPIWAKMFVTVSCYILTRFTWFRTDSFFTSRFLPSICQALGCISSCS